MTTASRPSWTCVIGDLFLASGPRIVHTSCMTPSSQFPPVTRCGTVGGSISDGCSGFPACVRFSRRPGAPRSSQEATDKVGEGRDDMSSHQGRHLLTTIPL